MEAYAVVGHSGLIYQLLCFARNGDWEDRRMKFRSYGILGQSVRAASCVICNLKHQLLPLRILNFLVILPCAENSSSDKPAVNLQIRNSWLVNRNSSFTCAWPKLLIWLLLTSTYCTALSCQTYSKALIRNFSRVQCLVGLMNELCTRDRCAMVVICSFSSHAADVCSFPSI